MKEVVVYIYIKDAFVPAGRLAFDNRGRFSTSIFRYGEKYLRRDDAIPIDPVQLPLIDKQFETDTGFDIFNGIRDAGPDRWGRYLLDKKFHKPLDELDYITSVGPDRCGALAFAEDTRGINEKPIKRLDLKLCVDAAEEAIAGGNTRALEIFLEYGPSLGGARPKATVMWNNKPHVAKFTLSMDKRNEALIEYATMSLAKKCGLNVPPIDRTQVSGRDIFLIQRFDRICEKTVERPVPFISGLTATGLHEQDYQQWSYLSLYNAIKKFSRDLSEDTIELYKRMVFNILVFNNDDHMRNHGFLYSGAQKWSLSPLYDVVPGSINTETYMLSMNIGDRGKEASLENARSAAKYFSLSAQQAEQIIAELSEACAVWEQHYSACGLSKQDIAKLRHSFAKK
jgi:serine/threonine-protein kinase HipA